MGADEYRKLEESILSQADRQAKSKADQEAMSALESKRGNQSLKSHANAPSLIPLERKQEQKL